MLLSRCHCRRHATEKKRRRLHFVAACNVVIWTKRNLSTAALPLTVDLWGVCHRRSAAANCSLRAKCPLSLPRRPGSGQSAKNGPLYGPSEHRSACTGNAASSLPQLFVLQRRRTIHAMGRSLFADVRRNICLPIVVHPYLHIVFFMHERNIEEHSIPGICMEVTIGGAFWTQQRYTGYAVK